jgi:hypothetical protein
MREITRSLFVIVLSFGLVTTLTLANMKSSYQATKTQSEKTRLVAVDAFSDLSRNLTSDSSASAGDSSASAGDSSASAGDSSASATAGGSTATAGTDNGGG